MIDWTPVMISKIKRLFPVELNDDVARKLGVSKRSVIRKARELGLEKADDFRAANGEKIGKKISKGQKASPHYESFMAHTFKAGSQIGKDYQFRPGHIESEEIRAKRSATAKKTWHQHHSKKSMETARVKRNKSIYEDKVRLKYGFGQKTNMRLKKSYIITTKYAQENNLI